MYIYIYIYYTNIYVYRYVYYVYMCMIVFMYASDIFSLNINILTFSDVSYNACNLVDVNK